MIFNTHTIAVSGSELYNQYLYLTQKLLCHNGCLHAQCRF